MQYTQTNIGRIFVVRFDTEEDMLEELKNLIKTENIKAGTIQILGAIAKTNAVVGPEKKEYPPNPVWWNSNDVKEIIGFGIFAWENEEPIIHLHSGFGNNNETKIACIRTETEVYITVECIIQEFIDTNISRKLDERYNASLLSFE